MLYIQVLFLLGTSQLISAEFVGKFVFHGKNDDQEHQASLSILHKPDSINIVPNPGPLPANEISSVLSLSLGLSVGKDITWNGLLSGSLFKRPKAVMLFSVGDIPKGAKLNMQATEKIPVKLTDDVSNIADVYEMTSTVSLAGHVNSMMDGHSTTASVSADEKIAAMGYSRGESSTTAFWSDMTDSWKVVSGDGQSKDGLTKHGVFKRIKSILPKGFILNLEEKEVVVNTKDLQFNFNLKNQVDLNLFSELVYMHWQYEEIAANKKVVKDGASDVYLFAVSALKGIEKQYGADFKQMKGALKLLESFIPKIVSEFSALYGGNIFIAGLTMQSEKSRMEPHKKELHAILKSLKDQVAHTFDFEHVIPELHVSKNLEHSARKNLCEAVQGAIAKFTPNIKFKCNDHSSTHKVYRRSLLAAADTSGDETTYNLAHNYDAMFPAIFNIWFWLLVVLAIATYAICVAMWNMDPGRDSIIYRLTQQKIKSE